MSATDEVLRSRLLATYGRARKNPGTQRLQQGPRAGFTPPQAQCCNRLALEGSSPLMYCPGAVVALAEVAVTVPAVFVVRAVVVLAVVALILRGVPFSVAALRRARLCRRRSRPPRSTPLRSRRFDRSAPRRSPCDQGLPVIFRDCVDKASPSPH